MIKSYKRARNSSPPSFSDTKVTEQTKDNANFENTKTFEQRFNVENKTNEEV
jgi:hypothetical protein